MNITDILLTLALAGLAIVIFLLIRKKDKGQNDSLIMQQLNNQNQVLDTKLSESNKMLQSQYSQSMKIIQDVTEKLTKLEDTNKQVISFTDQLQSLQDILKNPKQRGILGEYYLETLLKNVLPPGSYESQYKLGTDENGQELIPDAVVFIKEKIICIDAKFSLENYNRLVEEKDPSEKERLEKLFVNDLKNRIVETSKYIQPSKGTMDFAFMFIPHEAIYYDLIINKIGAVTEETENLIQRAASKYKVIIVSPTSFLAYLQTVLQGLRSLQIEESAKVIQKNVELLGKHIGSYQEYLKKLGNNLSTVVNCYNSANKEFGKIDKDVVKITGGKPGFEVMELDRPKTPDED
jgi:DNA recombination protein RmuC